MPSDAPLNVSYVKTATQFELTVSMTNESEMGIYWVTLTPFHNNRNFTETRRKIVHGYPLENFEVLINCICKVYTVKVFNFIAFITLFNLIRTTNQIH